MNPLSFDALRESLSTAGRAHHDYEQNVLKGVHDELWPGFYAAYVLGRLGDLLPASRLSELLEEAPLGGDWAAGAARHVIQALKSEA